MRPRAVLPLLALLALFPLVSADVGIGLRWTQESAVVPQGTTSCLTYLVYNPFDTDVDGSLVASKELAPLYSPAFSEGPAKVSKGTAPEAGIKRNICFDIPVLYPPGGIGPLFVSQSCPAESDRKEFKGEVAALSKPAGGVTSGVGSTTGTSVAAPLRLIVGCTPSPVAWTAPANLALYALIALIVASLVRKYRKPPEVRRQEKAERLKKQLEKLQQQETPKKDADSPPKDEAGPPGK